MEEEFGAAFVQFHVAEFINLCGYPHSDSYPDYKNIFEAVLSRGNRVTIVGRSVCPGCSALEGPSLWTAIVQLEELAEWRVHEDTPEERRRLGIDDEWLANASLG